MLRKGIGDKKTLKCAYVIYEWYLLSRLNRVIWRHWVLNNPSFRLHWSVRLRLQGWKCIYANGFEIQTKGTAWPNEIVLNLNTSNMTSINIAKLIISMSVSKTFNSLFWVDKKIIFRIDNEIISFDKLVEVLAIIP